MFAIFTQRERLRAGILGYPNGDMQRAANLQAAETVTAPPPHQLYTGNLLASKNPESDSEGLLDNPRPETSDSMRDEGPANPSNLFVSGL